jgi:hypothetical protein
MGNQQLEVPRNFENSHLLTYLSVDIASKSPTTHMQEVKIHAWYEHCGNNPSQNTNPS